MIKEFSNQYLQEVQNIEKKCFGKGFSNEAFYHYHQIVNHNFVIYQKDSQTIGYCIGSISAIDKDIGWIVSIGVIPEFQNQGIGSKLLINIINKLKNQVNKLRLSVSENNHSAYNFYLKNNFYEIKQPFDMYYTNKKSYLLEYQL